MSFKITLQHYTFMYKVIAGGLCCFAASNFYNGSERFYDNVIMPTLHLMGVERVHNLAVFANKHKLLPKSRYRDPARLHMTISNLQLTNPVGISSGFDKHAESVEGLHGVGFGFVEVGAVTPKLSTIDSVANFAKMKNNVHIQKYSFDNDEHDSVITRIKRLRLNKRFHGVVGVNLDKHSTSLHPVEDYVRGVYKFGPVADYLVVNLDRPSHAGCCETRAMLRHLLVQVVRARNALDVYPKPLLMVKLVPNLSATERKFIATVITSDECHVDGVIMPNVRSLRNDPQDVEEDAEVLSSISDMYGLTNGKIPIIVDGGVSSGRDAFEMIKAGASLIQIYTPYIYHGPPRVTRIKKDLNQLLQGHGYENVTQAVGVDINTKRKHYFFPFY